MKTLKELNDKAWFRLLKVVYLALYLPYLLILFIGILENYEVVFDQRVSVYDREIKEAIYFFLAFSAIYFLSMEIIKRAFYYVATGKVFPKE